MSLGNTNWGKKKKDIFLKEILQKGIYHVMNLTIFLFSHTQSKAKA